MLLIDTFNVLHLPQALREGRAIDVAALAGLIGHSRYAGQRAILVCDGTGGQGPNAPGPKGRLTVAGVEIVFSGAERSADDEIEARLRRSGGHGVVVVSDDKRLRRAGSRAGAKTLASAVFLGHLLADHDHPRAKPLPSFARDIPLDRYAVDHWMRQFGLSPNGLLDRRAGRAQAPRPASEPAGPPRPESEPQTRREPEAPEKPPGPPIPDERVLRMESLADDPVIREALEAWKGRLTLDDLDMSRWLSEHPPERDPRRRDQR